MIDSGTRSRALFTIVAVAVAVAFAAIALAASPGPAPSNPGTPTGPFGFAWGQPLNESGTSAPGCPATVGHYCYSVEIVMIGAGAPTTVLQMQLSLRSAGGAAIPWPETPASDLVSLISPVSGAAVSVYDTATSSWTLVGNFTGAFGAGYTVAVFTGGSGAAYGLLGDELVYTGVNGVTGTVPSAAFP